MLEYGSWGHFGQETATRFEEREEEGGEEDLADAGGRHGHVSLWSTGCNISCQTLLRLCPAHAPSIFAFSFFFLSLSFSFWHPQFFFFLKDI